MTTEFFKITESSFFDEIKDAIKNKAMPVIGQNDFGVSETIVLFDGAVFIRCYCKNTSKSDVENYEYASTNSFTVTELIKNVVNGKDVVYISDDKSDECFYVNTHLILLLAYIFTHMYGYNFYSGINIKNYANWENHVLKLVFESSEIAWYVYFAEVTLEV